MDTTSELIPLVTAIHERLRAVGAHEALRVVSRSIHHHVLGATLLAALTVTLRYGLRKSGC